MKYYVDGTVGLGGYYLNIYLVSAMVSQRGHQILCGWYLWIRQTLFEYSLGVSNSQPEGPSNIM